MKNIAFYFRGKSCWKLIFHRDGIQASTDNHFNVMSDIKIQYYLVLNTNYELKLKSINCQCLFSVVMLHFGITALSFTVWNMHNYSLLDEYLMRNLNVFHEKDSNIFPIGSLL